MMEQLDAHTPDGAPHRTPWVINGVPAPSPRWHPPFEPAVFAAAGGGADGAEPATRRGQEVIRSVGVLVVDDEDSFRQAFVNRLFDLSNAELHVAAVESGEDAIAELTRPAASFDFAFIDLNLGGGMSGLDTCDEIERIAPRLEVYLMTSDVDCPEALVARRRGFSIYNKWSLGYDLINILFGGPAGKEDGR